MRNYLLIACLIVLPLTANSALLERLGGLAYYDTEADLTWLADANAIAGTIYDSNFFYGSATDGATTWSNANAWAASLDIDGVTGWRLPNSDASCSSYDCTDSEMGNLFYNVFGGVSGEPIENNANYDLFNNISPYTYWSATEYSDTRAFTFWFVTGSQGNAWETNEKHAWAVHDGDVSSVPVPAAFWLFSSGLLGLIGLARRKKL